MELTRLTQIEARLKAATPGEWKIWGAAVMADQDGTSNAETAAHVADTRWADEEGRNRTFNASFIAHAHQDIPALVSALRVAVRELTELSEGDAHSIAGQALAEIAKVVSDGDIKSDISPRIPEDQL